MKNLTKKEISEKAIDLFLKNGYNNVTINDICSACEITKPTFYKYAGSKEELILDIYDLTIGGLVTDTYQFLQADTHFEQLLIVFSTLLNDTKKFGSDLFSQMLISNLNNNRNSFDMRDSLTDICEIIIQKAQVKGEIKNTNDAKVLYRSIAHMFTGYEVVWCIHDGQTNWEEDFYQSIIAILDVEEKIKGVYKKYLSNDFVK